MLGFGERIAFLLLVIVCGGLAWQGFHRMVTIVRTGKSADRSDGLVGRFVTWG